LYKIDVYTENTNRPSAIIKPLSLERDWMKDNIYHCMPLSVINKMGFGISFPKDISFIWDGNDDSPAEVLEGKEYCFPVRTYGTISMHTNFIFKTEEDVSLITMPVPNSIINDAVCLSTAISSSFFTGSLNIVWKATVANKVITIPANTDVASIMPISLKSIDNSVVVLNDKEYPFKNIHNTDSYLNKMVAFHQKRKNSKFYKKAIDENGIKIGDHELVNFKMRVING